jgi:hypothetical protein
MRYTATVDLDFSYRPDSYWEQDDPVEAILVGIKGEVRRRKVREAFENGDAGSIPELLLEDQLEEEDRQAWGAIDPLFMGGEYLPADLPGEVSIVRVSLNSTTGDVMALRARPVTGGIGYRITDEYETVFPLPFYQSPGPVTTAGVVRLLDETHDMSAHAGPGLVFGPVVMNYGHGVRTPEEVEKWRHQASCFATVQSSFYPGLGEWYRSRIEAWLDTLLLARWGTTNTTEMK